jgi:hypothetical protein
MPRKPRLNVKVLDKDYGYKRVATDLGGVTEITLGVFGAKAERAHPGSRGLSTGSVAFFHETGSGGMKQRSFIRAWMDKNTSMMVEDAAWAMKAVITGVSRKEVSAHIAKKWVSHMQAWIRGGNVRPPNEPSTIERKGHAIPMIGLTQAVVNAIGYKLKLPTTKSMKGTVKNAAARALNGIMSFNYDSEE